MKTFRMIGMALFAVLMCVNLASCSSDDDDDVQVPEDFTIIGTWKMIEGDDMDQWFIVFNEDGTGHESWIYGEYSDESTFTYRFDSEDLIIYTQYPNEAPRIWEITKISGKDVTIKYTYTDEETGQKHTIHFVFRKQ